MDEIIKVNDVSMRFNLAQEKTETLKEYTVKLLTHKLFFNEFYALKHVSFSMKRGRWRLYVPAEMPPPHGRDAFQRHHAAVRQP